eukprot:3372870-Prorocentrum_lima.AAC.1
MGHLVGGMNMVQYQEGEFTISGTLCGIPLENSIQRALMNDPGEPFGMWDSGASHFSLPVTCLPG